MSDEHFDLNIDFLKIDDGAEANDKPQASCIEPVPPISEKLNSCQHHICDLICHPRECQPCDQLIKQTCLSHGTEREVLCTNETGGTTTFTCGEPCGKLLSCGHDKCTKTCHDGPCSSCCQQLIIQCRCGESSTSISCIQAMQYDRIKNPFRCKERCSKQKSCTKHRCNKICCNANVHKCELVCDQTLNCGLHKCKERCHSQFCKNCDVFDEEIKCQCGKTIVKKQFECLQSLKNCYFQCAHQRECRHPANHWCHNDNQCPPCRHPVSKMCVGGHMALDVPCHIQRACCPQACGKSVACGVHTCQRSCHSGLCQSFDQKCTQRCNINRRECGHTCNLICHGSEPCPVTTCEAIIKVRCQCGSLIKDVICNVKSYQFNEEKVHIDSTSFSQALLSRTTSFTFSFVPKPKQELQCDDECFIIQRNQKLTQACLFSSHKPRPLPTIYTHFLREYAKKNLEFVQNIERQFAQLITDTKNHHALMRYHSFQPMQFNERYFIHQLAAFYGLGTHATGCEPNRYIVLCGSFDLSQIPRRLLSETPQ